MIKIDFEVLLPLKVFSVGGRIFVQVLEVVGKVFWRLKVLNIDERFVWSQFWIVCAAVDYGDNIERKNFEELLCDVIVAEGILKTVLKGDFMKTNRFE